MLDIKFIRNNVEKIKQNIKNRGMSFDLERLLSVDEERRRLINEIEPLRAEQKKVSEEIAKEKEAAIREEKISSMKKIKEEIVLKEKELKVAEEEFEKLMRQVPNMIQPDTPIGQSEADNKVLREVGKKPKFKFQPCDYLSLAQELDLIDTERAAKVSGSRFGYLKGAAAKLEFALVQMAIDILEKEKFIPVVPPVLIKPEAMEAMGYIDTEEEKEERYYLEKDDLYLVGTSEQSLGPMHAGEILEEENLPLRYVGFSSCFRREAGSYGKDTKGILRVHQFDKVEMFSFCQPEYSIKEHQLILKLEEKLMQELELPYRVVQLCSVDFARPSSATFDIEAWLPGQNGGQGQYRETHSCSNCTDYQARRLNIRYRNKATGKVEFLHTLNGTAFAIGRTIIAILENYQQADGTIKVPKTLSRYCGLKYIGKKK